MCKIRSAGHRSKPREPAPPHMETMRSEVEEVIGKTTAATSEDRIKAQHHRIQRGLLLYETCSSEELRVFCQQRGIHFPPRSHRIARRARDELIGLLEAADENNTFHRYIDLPPELGLLVIEAYMSFVPGPYIDDKPPPICGVSRNVRHEALNIFYQNYRLDLTFDLRTVPPDLDVQLRFAMEEELPISEIEYIKKFFILGLFGHYGYCNFTLDISKDGKSYQLSKAEWTNSEKWRKVAAKMLERMNASLDGILSTDGKIVLSAPKIWAWREMWEMALKEVENEERIKWLWTQQPLGGPPLPPES
ncbi:hypothetical protein HII31_11914 [Pseudocercospora fuligena]|uniref:Uncharacterized protein n=1 Tax=Pseudocercospora fuligena TaxID=685502 RepID=A0A8H6RA58_9PEZI|nr:hypothetical protein HII31_11914 [Pseudocercospora fuligena]